MKLTGILSLLCIFFGISANGKSIGEVRDFEELKFQGIPIVADIFFVE